MDIKVFEAKCKEVLKSKIADLKNHREEFLAENCRCGEMCDDCDVCTEYDEEIDYYANKLGRLENLMPL